MHWGIPRTLASPGNSTTNERRRQSGERRVKGSGGRQQVIACGPLPSASTFAALPGLASDWRVLHYNHFRMGPWSLCSWTFTERRAKYISHACSPAVDVSHVALPSLLANGNNLDVPSSRALSSRHVSIRNICPAVASVLHSIEHPPPSAFVQANCITTAPQQILPAADPTPHILLLPAAPHRRTATLLDRVLLLRSRPACVQGELRASRAPLASPSTRA